MRNNSLQSLNKSTNMSIYPKCCHSCTHQYKNKNTFYLHKRNGVCERNQSFSRQTSPYVGVRRDQALSLLESLMMPSTPVIAANEIVTGTQPSSASIQSNDAIPIPSARQSEAYYQAILERRHNGGHLQTATGITDITTATMHIEIKTATNWKDGYRQLIGYNAVCPRRDLRLYLFNTADLTDNAKRDLMRTVMSWEVLPRVSLYYLANDGSEECIFNAIKFFT